MLADGALRSADAGAIHQHARDAVGAFGFYNRSLDLVLVGDVGVQGNALYFGRDLFGILLVLIEHGDFRAFGGHGVRGGGAETGATAGDENGNVFQLHGVTTFPWAFLLRLAGLQDRSIVIRLPRQPPCWWSA